MKKVNHRFSLGLIFALVSVAALGGCAGGAAPGEPARQSGSEAASSLENCDTTLETDPTPERVVTIKSTPLELLLSLGLEDRIVGSAFLDGTVPESLAPAGWSVTELSDQVPGRELLLSVQPDFVFAGWASNLSAEGPGTRDQLEEMGIRSYISPAACDFGEETPAAVTFDDVFEMFTEIGDIFEVPERAESLIAEQREQLTGIERVAEPLTALWYSSGEDTPFVGGGTGTPNMIMEAAGLDNAAGDQAESWLSMSWEAFVSSDPDVIVLVNSPWNSAEAKRQRIEAHPAAQSMRAVREGNYISVDFATTEAGVRNVDAVETIAAGAIEIARRG